MKHPSVGANRNSNDSSFYHSSSNTTSMWFQNGFLIEIVLHASPLDFETKMLLSYFPTIFGEYKPVTLRLYLLIYCCLKTQAFETYGGFC